MDAWYPRCFFSLEDYRAWLFFNRMAGGAGRVTYCHDCDPETQAEMLAQDRCEHPEVIFVEVRHWTWDEPEIIGVIPSESKYAPKKFRRKRDSDGNPT